jgi:hypothetical protein
MSVVSSRIAVIVFVLVAASASAAAPKGRVEPRAKLETGDYTWHPETSPKGPVLVVVSLPQQQAYVYRNGVLIGCSVFTVLQKKEKHTCSTGFATTSPSRPSS